MRIVVPIKQVPETSAVKMDETTGTMIREGVEAIVNPLDLYAIETAVGLRESHGGEVVAISMGPPKAITALREAIAMGCDHAVLISDKAFAGSDTWATSYVLAAAIRKLDGGAGASPAGSAPNRRPDAPSAAKRKDAPDRDRDGLSSIDLVICGERATDGDTGQVGPGIASFLNLPVVTYVSRIESFAGNGQKTVRLRRLTEEGYEVLDVDSPAVLAVVKEIAAPRLPTLRGKQKAKKTEIPCWGVADLDIDPARVGLDGSPTRVVKIFRPAVARQCEKVLAGDEQAVQAAVEKLVDFLRTKELM